MKSGLEAGRTFTRLLEEVGTSNDEGLNQGSSSETKKDEVDLRDFYR